ncbi:MAG: hypothetical protein PUE85_09710 [Firmicutes bacterium]|nr:hypothetical protein [Bacillota bacterium]
MIDTEIPGVERRVSVYSEPGVLPMAVAYIIKSPFEGDVSEIAGGLAKKGAVVCCIEANGGVDTDLCGEITKLNEAVRKKYRMLPCIMYGIGLGAAYLRDYLDKNHGIADGAVFDRMPSRIENDVSVMRSLKIASFFGKNKPACKKNLSAVLSAIDFGDKTGFTLTNSDCLALSKLITGPELTEWAGGIPKSLPIFIVTEKENDTGADALFDALDGAEICSLSHGKRSEVVGEWLNEVCDGVVCMRRISL